MIEAKKRRIDMPSTTSSDEIISHTRRMKNAGHNVMIVSTYHSHGSVAHALRSMGIMPEATVSDEAHFIAGNKEWRESVPSFNSVRKWYLTATPSEGDDTEQGWGMNNHNRYGPVLHTMSPAEAIAKGIIVPPHIYIEDATSDAKKFKGQLDLDNDCLPLIERAFSYHRHNLLSTTYDPEQIDAKMLVVHDGIGSQEAIFKSRDYQKAVERMGARWFAINSDAEFRGYIGDELTKEGKPRFKVSKDRFLDKIDAMRLIDTAIINHIDMLSEGVDCPGFSAVMFLKNCGVVKACQNIGRATRPHPLDRYRINIGELRPGDFDNYIKPHASIILPRTTQNNYDFIYSYRGLLSELRNNWGFVPSLHIHNDYKQPKGKPAVELGIKERQRKKIVHVIEDLFISMDEQRQANKLDDLIHAIESDDDILDFAKKIERM